MVKISETFFEYLRVSVTDRCNLRCIYCMPEGGIPKLSHEQVLGYEEIIDIVAAAIDEGVFRLRITGGEPLVRKGIVGLIEKLSKLPGLSDLSLTTNGILLEKYAEALKDAGLARVNVSLDSLDPEKFRQITRLGDLTSVLTGIDKAVSAGLKPLKINVVVMPGVNDDEIDDFVKFACDNPVCVRFIELMPFLSEGKQSAFVSEERIVEDISRLVTLEPIGTGKIGGGPANEYSIRNGAGSIGFISSRSRPFCSKCRRLRLTSSGELVPCLDSRNGKYVRGLSRAAIREIIRALGTEKRNLGKTCPAFVSSKCVSLSDIGG